MANRPRKSSACVTLVLIGAAALSGCGDTSTTNRRAAYATKDQCLADWNDPKDCEEQPATGTTRSWGPSSSSWHSYSSGSRSSSSSSSSSSSHSISRGGFGSHGSSSS